MEIFHVDSFKRDNGKIIGVTVLQAKAPRPWRLYFSAEHVYHQQNSGDPDKIMITYEDKNTGKHKSFRIKAEQVETEYYIKEPDSDVEKQVFQSIPEYSYLPTDFL